MRFFAFLASIAIALLALPAAAQSVSLSAPASASMNAVVDVQWTGPDGAGDYIGIGNESGKPIPYSSYFYTANSKGGIGQVRLPERTGNFTIVYVSKADGPLHAVPITAEPVTATLEAPASVAANSDFEVAWTGPNLDGDRITIGTADGRAMPYQSRAYTNDSGPTVTMHAPEQPGDYSVVYLTGDTVIASVPFTSAGLDASIEAPETVPAGTAFTIRWTGPDNPGDRVRIHDADGTWIPYASYAYTSLNPGEADLVAPEDLGPFTVAYVTGDTVVTTTPITVVEVTASLLAEDEVTAGLPFPVTWDGPGNPRDVIHLVGDDPNFPLERGYIANSDGNVVMLEAPGLNGDFQLRYMTPGGKQLAERPIRIVAPPEQPGTLVVLPVTGFTSLSALEVILDASGSMLQRQGDTRRIDIAKATLSGLLRDTVPPGTPFALRVFGNRETDSCRTDLEVPLAPLDTAATLAFVEGIEAINLARTPIGRSLELVESDLSAADGENLVILITDGEETCEGDPAASIATLRGKGKDVRVNIVGYAIDDAGLEATFADWAELGGGSYFSASDADQLASALQAAAQPAFTVVDADGNVVGRGLAGDDAITLPAGTYEVRVAGNSVAADVRPETETTVSLN